MLAGTRCRCRKGHTVDRGSSTTVEGLEEATETEVVGAAAGSGADTGAAATGSAAGWEAAA
jgi:hypothetical protein